MKNWHLVDEDVWYQKIRWFSFYKQISIKTRTKIYFESITPTVLVNWPEVHLFWAGKGDISCIAFADWKDESFQTLGWTSFQLVIVTNKFIRYFTIEGHLVRSIFISEIVSKGRRVLQARWCQESLVLLVQSVTTFSLFIYHSKTDEHKLLKSWNNSEDHINENFGLDVHFVDGFGILFVSLRSRKFLYFHEKQVNSLEYQLPDGISHLKLNHGTKEAFFVSQCKGFFVSLMNGEIVSTIPLPFNLLSNILQVEWCGDDYVCIHSISDSTTSTLTFVGIKKKLWTMQYNSMIRIHHEIDGIKVYTETHCEFVRKVPCSIASVFKFGSLEPPARLYDLYVEIQNELNTLRRKDPKMREDEWNSAIFSCQEAALLEFNPSLRKKLVKASLLGDLLRNGKVVNQQIEYITNMKLLNILERDSLFISYQQSSHILQSCRNVLLQLISVGKEKTASEIYDLGFSDEVENFSDLVELVRMKNGAQSQNEPTPSMNLEEIQSKVQNSLKIDDTETIFTTLQQIENRHFELHSFPDLSKFWSTYSQYSKTSKLSSSDLNIGSERFLEFPISTQVISLETQKDHALFSRAYQNQITMYRVQQELKKMGFDMDTGSTLARTLFYCMEKGVTKQMEELSSICSNEKRITWMKALLFAKNGNWIEFKNLCIAENTTRWNSNFGYSPFVELAMKYQNQFLAKEFCSSIKDTKERVCLYYQMGEYESAIEAAGTDVEMLTVLYRSFQPVSINKRKQLQEIIKLKLDEPE